MKKVLIVDNNPVILRMLSEALEKEKFTVVTAPDGLSAFDTLHSFIPDIIFLDLIMPNINGEQFCQMIYGRADLVHTKIIVISGVASESQGECDIKGVDGCIAKGRHLVKHVINLAHEISNQNFESSYSNVLGVDEVFPREISKELLAANRHLKIILQNTNEGIIELALDGRIIFANPAASNLAGLSEKEILAKQFTDIFSGSHKQLILDTLQKAKSEPAIINDDTPVLFNNQYVSINFLPVHDKKNDTIIAIIQNINKRKIAELKLRDTNEYLHSIFNSAQAGIIVIDAETHQIIDANPKALKIFEVSKAEMVNSICNDFVCPTENGNCPILDDGENTHEVSQLITNSLGQRLHILKTASTSIINGKRYIIESFLDISEQKALEAKLHALAITDELTGLMNRRGFMMMANKQLQIVDRTEDKLLLLFADVDNLKWVNDTYGHDAGDVLLTKVAKILSSLRSSDIIARLGGDEFAILVPDSGGDSMDEDKLISRFNKLLENENKESKYAFDLSISFGVATYDPATPCDIEELIIKADQRMYSSKKLKKSN